MLGLDIAYLCKKFDHYSFSRSRYMVSAHQNLNGSRDLTYATSVYGAPLGGDPVGISPRSLASEN